MFDSGIYNIEAVKKNEKKLLEAISGKQCETMNKSFEDKPVKKELTPLDQMTKDELLELQMSMDRAFELQILNMFYNSPINYDLEYDANWSFDHSTDGE